MGNKMKTHKGVSKRFKVSGRGKVRARRAGKSHLMSSKSGKRLRKLRRPLIVSNEAIASKIRRAMGQ